MSEPNLNANPIKVETRERFDLKKHVHDESAFFSGVKMFVSVIVSLASIAVALLGGTYLLITGTPQDFYQKPVPPAEKNNKTPEMTPAQEKSLQEKVAAVMDDYRTGWNSGSFPTNLTTSGFVSRDSVGKASTNATDFYDSKQTIQKLKVTNIAQVTSDEVSATVAELVRYDTGIKNWFINAGGTDQEGNLVVDRIVETEYRLVNSGGWKIKSREWKRQTGALIQQEGDATLSWKMDEGDIAFDDKRPSKETLAAPYATIASEIQSGYLSSTNFPSGYKVTFQSGGSIDRSEIQGRLTKLCANVKDLTVTATINSVEQTGPKSATATVTYSAQFTPFSYGPTGLVEKSKNQYVAVWKDQDTWTRYSDTDTYWHRESTTRLERSPIWQHYEAQTPPRAPSTAPTGSSATSTSNLPNIGE